MAVKKVESFNMHETPAINQNEFDVETYLNANWEKTKEAVNNNAEELIQSQKDIDANKNDIENINSKNKSQDDTIEALKAENNLIKEQIPSASVSGNSVHIEDSGTLDFDWKINGNQHQATREGYNLLNWKKWKDGNVIASKGTVDEITENSIIITSTGNDCYTDTYGITNSVKENFRDYSR